MIKKKEWEKSFKNVNGRMPTVEEYKEAVSEGMVQNESLTLKGSKKFFFITSGIIGSLLIIAIAILLFIFFYPKPVNQQSSFNDIHSQDSSSIIDNSDEATEESTKNNFSSNIEESETKENITESSVQDNYGMMVKGYYVVKYSDMLTFLEETTGKTSEGLVPRYVAEFWNSHHASDKKVESPIDLRLDKDKYMWSNGFIICPLTMTAGELVNQVASTHSDIKEYDLNQTNIDKAIQYWNSEHESYNAVAMVPGSNVYTPSYVSSFPEVTDEKDYRYFKRGINAPDIYGISGTEIPEK